LPKFLVQRFVSQNQDAVIVSGRAPDKDSAQLLPIVQQLNGRLDAIRAAHPAFEIAPTGLSVIAARNSANMINKLNRGLTAEFAFLAIFVGLAFRSVPVMLAILPAGLFPILAAGSLLRALGDGLQFASIVALTVSFGLGLSATIHFLNRMWVEDRAGAEPAIAVERSTVLIGPALILTTFVLACGLADIRANAVAEGGRVRGDWQETTRGVQGILAGTIGGGHFNGSVSGQDFSATVSLRSVGRKEFYILRPNSGDVASVSIVLSQ
jgi:hypothetical protein